MVMLKLLIFTGLRNAELSRLRLSDVDLDHCQLRVRQGKGGADRSVLLPSSFRGELAQYIQGLRYWGATEQKTRLSLQRRQAIDGGRVDFEGERDFLGAFAFG